MQNSEKDFSILEIYAVSPSVMCSTGVGRFNVEDTMKFSMDIQKLPRLISVAYKKNLKRTDKKDDSGSAAMRRGDLI